MRGTPSTARDLGLLPLVFALAAPYVVCHADIGKGKVSFGLNSPGAGVRYFPVDRIAVEARGQSASGVFAAGLRGCYYLSPLGGLLPLAGLEGDWISFAGRDSKGSGWAAEGLVGLEYFVLNRLSIQVDVGPAFVFVKDAKTALSASGIQYAVNLGVNWYFDHGETQVHPAHEPPPAAGTSHLTPQDAESLYQESLTLYATQNYDGAWAKAAAAATANPMHWQAWQMIGNCQYAKSDAKGALASYQQALALNPDNPSLRQFVDQLAATIP